MELQAGTVAHRSPPTASSGVIATTVAGSASSLLSSTEALAPRSSPESTQVGLGVGLGLVLPIVLLLAACLVWRHRRSHPTLRRTAPSPPDLPAHISPSRAAHARSTSHSQAGYATLGSGTGLPVSTGPFELKGFRQKELVLGPGQERTPTNSVVGPARGTGVGGTTTFA